MRNIQDYNNRTIHVIGGGGGIGRWFLEKIFISEMSICYDINDKNLNSLPDKVKYCHVTDSNYGDFYDNFSDNDWVIFAVPLVDFDNAVGSLLRIIDKKLLLISMCSVQEISLNIIKNYIRNDSSSLGCHPLFGISVISAVGNIVTLTNYDKAQSLHASVYNFLSKKGFLISFLQAKEHDAYMAYVQALTHFILMGFIETLIVDEVDPLDLMKIRTPNFLFLYAFASRVLKIAPTTTGSIQSTKEASFIRMKFLKVISDLDKNLCQAKNAGGCACVIEDIRNKVNSSQLDEGVQIASVAVDSVQRFEEYIHRYRESGAIFIFKHKKTRKIYFARVKDNLQNEVLFEVSMKLIKSSEIGKDKYAIGLNENARVNYRRIGLSLPEIQEVRIKKRYIKLLPYNEVKQFLRENILPVSIVTNFSNPNGLEEDYLENSLPLVIKGLFECEFINSYRRRKEQEKVTLKLTFDPNEDINMLCKRIRNVFENNVSSLTTM